MALYLKDGVTLNGIQPELLLAIWVIEQCFSDSNLRTTITSLTDGEHSKDSLHYVGLAVDVRIWDLVTKVDQEEMCIRLRKALGKESDVVLESTHIHVEFDPK